MAVKKPANKAVEGTTNTVSTSNDGATIISGPTTNEEAAAETDAGEGAYGTRHIMEEQMRAAGMGVFSKDAGRAPSNKSSK